MIAWIYCICQDESRIAKILQAKIILEFNLVIKQTLLRCELLMIDSFLFYRNRVYGE